MRRGKERQGYHAGTSVSRAADGAVQQPRHAQRPAQAQHGGHVLKTVPGAPACAVLLDMSGALERFQVILDCVAVGSGDRDRVGDGDPAALTAQFQNLYREFGQVAKQESLALDFFLKPRFLPLQRLEEKAQPGLPVRSIGTYGSLRPAQTRIVRILVLLDDAFEGTVGHVCISRTQQQ